MLAPSTATMYHRSLFPNYQSTSHRKYHTYELDYWRLHLKGICCAVEVRFQLAMPDPAATGSKNTTSRTAMVAKPQLTPIKKPNACQL